MSARLMSPGYRAHFNSRVLSDCLAEASAGYWRRRADQLRFCLSHPNDDSLWNQRATSEQRAQRAQEIKLRDARVLADVQRCLDHASLLDSCDGGISPDVVDVLNEVA